MLFQAPTLTEFTIYKATSGNHTYRSHVVTACHVSPDSNFLYVSDSAAPGGPTANSAYSTGSNANNKFEACIQGGAFTSFDSAAYSNDAMYDQVRDLHHHSGSSVGSIRCQIPGGVAVMQKATRSVSITAGYAGVYVGLSGGKGITPGKHLRDPPATAPFP